MSFALKSVAIATLSLTLLSAHAQKGETVKIALIDPQTGLMGPLGLNQMRSWQFFAEKFSATNPAGVKFEMVAFDNKLSPAESLNAFKAALDQGVRYIAQGNGSSVAGALIDAVNKHNERNPGKEVIFLNYAAVDPDFTNSKCSYWHFRFDADTSMKMEAMTTFMKDQKDVKAVYLLNQNYSHGQQVAKFAKENLARKRPDVKVVGEDLHPLAQVRDFAPYIAKIKASGADTVITGNWGSDLALLIKAANEGGYTGKFYTYYTGVTGTPTALGTGGEGRVFQVAYSHYNMGGQMGQWMADFKTRYKDDMFTGAIPSALNVLGAAMAKAKSTDPVKVAAAMEGLKVNNFNGEVEVRKLDHQLQQALFLTVWQKADQKYPYSPENTGMTLAPVKEFPSYVSSTPTSCQMKRPG
ncbi:MAG: branched-chain amino acid ABC transporter substrate-binding protein [Hydrogenophaga sp.]|uniref:branched-chain amino acid ABC transporter substrate-binding protein n=1 Tax=Hydrogenophaga sp. TaxID=1904254 RepID=UPI0008BE8FF7|nr:branched-chain amino acid ABC transporter substrate-binding protein [Hydrogenophaga sp.]MBU4180062.1 branched-chain amino acid ABC transporter substrate-binding protein [Gammaproteobacteria bacterium]OGB42428.1 MAG: branched-chain amino acid ABC transporter substrate-binding protein [Burkholderiales bacterium RIFCSPHIGHO2_12_FULL_67_38]PKO78914.1 MAG: branched-chain amino acid ABC transporter substrate-binding protein [Betaproteobacteria bacterium HGW-Betaproteobacteria-15]MBU4279381.1 branc